MEQWWQRIREWFDDAAAALRRLIDGSRSPRRPARDAADRGDGDERYDGRTVRSIDSDAAVVVATAEDDAASLIGRIDTADAAEVVLVVQRDARALRRPSAWPHISAHVRRRGIELAVVSPRRDVRTFARQNGLRAASGFNSLRSDPVVVRVGERDIPVPPVPWGRLVRAGMILAVLVAAFIVGCFEVPSAEVTIAPRSTVVEASGEARPNAIVDLSDAEAGVIRATTIRRQIYTAVSTAATGETEVGDASASVDVQFNNGSSEAVQIPAGTRLATEDGIGFITNGSAEMVAGADATVVAVAEESGVLGNVAVGTVVTGDLPAGVTVTNVTAGAGGTNMPSPAVTQADVDRVHEIAPEVLQRVALNTLTQDLEEGTLLPSSISVAIFSEQPVQALEEASRSLIVDYVITVSALVISEDEANRYGEALLRAELPGDQELLPGSVTTTVAVGTGRTDPVTITAQGRAAELEEIEAVKEELTGKSINGAKAYLEERLELFAPPEVEVSPNFIPWLWLPRRASHIEIVVANPDAPDAEAEGTPDPDATTDPLGTTPDPDATATVDATTAP